ncbi:MAG: SGNH/GDSL hydrolase family protein [Adhaeribacter sp.]
MKAHFRLISYPKKLGLLAFFAAGCLSPASVAWLFTADGQLPFRALNLVCWALSGGMAFFGLAVFTSRLRLARPVQQVLGFLLFGFVPLLASVLLDRALGAFLLPPAHHLVFAPHTSARYHNPEFSVTTRINHLGFRDHDYPLGKQDRYRILVLGSSFTFGWGVPLADTWVKKLEKELRQRNARVEVMNLGRIGASPEAYRDIARKAIPLLRPDLVVVSLLQGTEWVSELVPQPQNQVPSSRFLSLRQYPDLLRANTYPNLLRLFRETGREVQIQPLWQAQAGDMWRRLTARQQQRLAALPALVQNRFRRGELNPDLVYSYLQHPDLFLQLEQASPALKTRALERLGGYLGQIRQLAARQGAPTLLLQVPNKFYFCPEAMLEHQSLGAQTDTALVGRNTPDSLVQVLARHTGLPLLNPVPALQASCGRQRLYYRYDSHLNALGHQRYAAEAGQLLLPYLPASLIRK